MNMKRNYLRLALCVLVLPMIAAAASLPPEDALIRQYLNKDYQKKHFAVSFRDRDHLESNYPPQILKCGAQNDPLLKLGYLNVKYYASGNGKTDDTAALRRAIYDAAFYDLTAYFPSGTYLVSEPILCRMSISYQITRKGFFLQGASNPRPVIKLADHAARFQNAKDPQALLQFWLPRLNTGKSVDPEKWLHTVSGWKYDGSGKAWLMSLLGLRDIDFDLGSGNPGAAAIRCAGAQGNYIENVTVQARDGFAGLYDLLGAGGYMANIRIVGGRYGIYATEMQPGCIAGITLENQKELAFLMYTMPKSFPLVGFRIIKEKGPVFLIKRNANPPFESKANAPSGSLQFVSLIDGTIELKQGGPVVEIDLPKDKEDGNVFMKNVYVRGADALVRGSTARDNVPVAFGAPWTHVKIYGSALGPTENLVKGKRIQEPFKQVAAANTAPSDLVARHLWEKDVCPHPMDPDVVSLKDPKKMGEHAAKGDGKTDDTEAFRYAIAHFEKILIPKGVYMISGPLLLRPETKLFGTSVVHSILILDEEKWKTPKGPEPVIITADDPDARTMVGYFSLFCPTGRRVDGIQNLYTYFLWRSGRHSVYKQIRAKVYSKTGYVGAPAGPWAHPYQNCIITGNGGGKWYGVWIQGFPKAGYRRNNTGPLPEYRDVLIDGTHEPLAFYTSNPEHAVPSAEAEVEIRNSRNVQIYGTKSESTPEEKDLYFVKNSRNVTMVGYSGIRTLRTGYSFFRVVDSRDICLGSIQMSQKQDRMEKGSFTVLQVDAGRKIGIASDKHVNLYWR